MKTEYKGQVVFWEESEHGIIDKHDYGCDVAMDGYVEGEKKYEAIGYKLGEEPIEILEYTIEKYDNQDSDKKFTKTP
jgi:hypothetical protein